MTLTELRDEYRKHINGKTRPYIKQRPPLMNIIPTLIKNSKGVIPRGPAYKRLMRLEMGVVMSPYKVKPIM